MRGQRTLVYSGEEILEPMEVFVQMWIVGDVAEILGSVVVRNVRRMRAVCVGRTIIGISRLFVIAFFIPAPGSSLLSLLHEEGNIILNVREISLGVAVRRSLSFRLFPWLRIYLESPSESLVSLMARALNAS